MIEWIEFESKALKGFPMKDPHRRTFPVYLPPTYHDKNEKRFPVAFFLAGWGSKSASYISDQSAFGIPLQERFDRMILSNELPAFIGVFPDGSSRLGGSQYLNSASLGHYSDYLCDELTDFIDSKFRTLAEPGARAILGHSSGGFGALINAIERPDRFLFAGSSAGDSFFELSLLPTVTAMVDEIEKAGGIKKFVEDFLASPNPMKGSRSKGEAMMGLSMAACYSPNPKVEAILGNLFFDLKTGQIIPEIWNQYLAWDPLNFVPRKIAQAQKLKYILLDAGKQDEYGLQLGQRRLMNIFQENKINSEIEEYSGGHSGHSWRYADRLKKILKQMLN